MQRVIRLLPMVLVLGCGGGNGADPDPDGPISEPAAITMTLRDPGATTTSNASFVAVRDGDGAWTEVTGDNGVYSARVTSNRYGWWVGCVRSTGSGRNSIVYRHLDDGTDFERSSCASQTFPLTISGAITGIAEPDSVEVYSLFSFTFPFEGTYEVGNEVGPGQLLASRLDADLNGVSVIRADLGNLTANATRDLDFAQAQPFVRTPITVNGREPGDLVETYAGVYVGDGSMYLPFEAARETAELIGLPAAMRLPGDKFDSTATAISQDGAITNRRSTGALSTTIPTTFTLPPVKSFGDATATEGPFSIGWSLPAIAADAEVSAFWLAANRDNRFVITSILASSKWSADSTRIDITELAGLPSALSQLPGDTFNWSIDEIRGDFFAGEEFISTGTQGTVGPSALRAHVPSRTELRAMHQARIAMRR